MSESEQEWARVREWTRVRKHEQEWERVKRSEREWERVRKSDREWVKCTYIFCFFTKLKKVNFFETKSLILYK